MAGKILLLTALLVGTVTVVRSDVDSLTKAKAYLKKYGYMKDDDDSKTAAAMKQFQYMANVSLTGVFDEDTRRMMNMPRCGVVDIMDSSDTMRKRRYTLGANDQVYKWPRTDLTYRIDSRTPDISNPNDVDTTMEAALQVWADVTQLTFRRVSGGTAADIIITFSSGDHRDGNAFDGPSGVLAHAYFPTTGDAHFDEDETWTINTSTGINLFQVAAHEFGHSLGLGHSTIDEALMAPFYRGYVPNFQLHSDDIAGITQLYGANSGMPEGTMPPVEPPAGESCSGRLDAITSTAEGHTYILDGSNVWKRVSGANKIADGFPKPIGEVFAGLPDNVDAALYLSNTGKTYFFKGTQYWQYTNEKLDAGYPRMISQDLPGLPNDLDAAIVWSRNNRIYFFKGNKYYHYSRGRADAGLLSEWRIPGNQVSAAFQWTENFRTYFFNAQGNYYLYDDRNVTVYSQNYPRSVAQSWQGCVRNLELMTATPTQPSGVSGLAPSILVVVTSLVAGAFHVLK